jgi:hypothetical protein
MERARNFDLKVQIDLTVSLCNKQGNVTMVLKLAFGNRNEQSLIGDVLDQKKKDPGNEGR